LCRLSHPHLITPGALPGAGQTFSSKSLSRGDHCTALEEFLLLREISSTLRFLRFLLFDSEKLAEDNAGNEEQADTVILYPCPPCDPWSICLEGIVLDFT
jgi:hypothetical protein